MASASAPNSTSSMADRLRAFGYGSSTRNNNNNNSAGFGGPTTASPFATSGGIGSSGPSIFGRISSTASTGWSSFSNRLQGFTPLGESQEQESWYGLSYYQRMIGFAVCLVTGCVFFIVAFFTLPWLLVVPRKFAVSFTFGSLFVMASFALFKGPHAHLMHLISRDRLPFTITYITSMVLTLYFALGLKSYLLTLIGAIIQIVALIWYTVSYLPGGRTTLVYGTRTMSRSVSSLLPI